MVERQSLSVANFGNGQNNKWLLQCLLMLLVAIRSSMNTEKQHFLSKFSSQGEILFNFTLFMGWQFRQWTWFPMDFRQVMHILNLTSLQNLMAFYDRMCIKWQASIFLNTKIVSKMSFSSFLAILKKLWMTQIFSAEYDFLQNKYFDMSLHQNPLMNICIVNLM